MVRTGHFDRGSFFQFGHVFALLILSPASPTSSTAIAFHPPRNTAHGSTHLTAALAIGMIERASETRAS